MEPLEQTSEVSQAIEPSELKPRNTATARNRKKAREKSSKPLRDAPWAGSPEAKAVAAAAAAAVGLSLEQLSDLMVDTGLAIIPKERDKITQKYTLEDAGKRLWSSMQLEHPAKRVSWFAGLAPLHKIAILVTLRDRGYHFEVIAREFGIPVRMVIDAWNMHCDELGAQVVGVRLQTIAGQLQSHSSMAQQMAIEAGDHNGFWKISAEYVEMLQSLGIVDRAVHRVDHEHSHKFEDQHQVELDKFVDLEMKKRARREELKLVDAVVTDSVPRLEMDYDDEQEKP